MPPSNPPFRSNTREFEPLPADDVMRAETETTLAEEESVYDELIATHEALQEAHTDEQHCAVVGPRQCGKTTLARALFDEAPE